MLGAACELVEGHQCLRWAVAPRHGPGGMVGVLYTVQPMTWQGLAGDLAGPQPGCLCRATVTVAGSSHCSKVSQPPWTWRSWSARWLLKNLSWKRRQVKCPPLQAVYPPPRCTPPPELGPTQGPGCFLLAMVPAPWDGLHPVTSWARTGVLARGTEYHLPCRHAGDGER